MPEQTGLAVRKTIVVSAAPEAAFRTFTEEIGAWWPLATHSVFGGNATGVTFEGGLGGSVLETGPEGAVGHWGTITTWEPPSRFAMTWHPGSDDPAQHTDLEVTFTAEGTGTRVELLHTGWERLGERAAETAAGYTSGWDTVLGHYSRALNKEG